VRDDEQKTAWEETKKKKKKERARYIFLQLHMQSIFKFAERSLILHNSPSRKSFICLDFNTYIGHGSFFRDESSASQVSIYPGSLGHWTVLLWQTQWATDTLADRYMRTGVTDFPRQTHVDRRKLAQGSWTLS